MMLMHYYLVSSVITIRSQEMTPKIKILRRSNFDSQGLRSELVL